MGIFGNYAHKYFEAGYLVLPTYGKRPAFDEWNKPENLQDIDFLASTYHDANIGVLLGKESKIVAFDFDLDRDGFGDLNAIDTASGLFKVLPETAVFKRGKKGVTLFYQYSEDLVNLSSPGVFDFLVSGKQTVLPPSEYYEIVVESEKVKRAVRRPEYDYRWSGLGLLDVSPNDLPRIKQSHILQVKSKLAQYEIQVQRHQTKMGVGGRNNKLYQMACAALEKFKDVEEIAQELLIFDEQNHIPPWFSDSSEHTNQKTPFERSLQLVKTTKKNLQSRGKLQQPKDVVDISTEMESVVEKEDHLPPLPDFLTTLSKYFGNGDNQKNGSTLASLIFMSIFLGKRIEFKHPKTGRRTAPNLYGFHVGSSGSGKGILKNRLIELVKQCKDTMGNVCLTGLPKSDAALHRFFQKPVVCMLSEEFHQVLTAINMGNKNFAAINETLAEIYSASTGVLLEKKAADSKFDADEVVEPYLSLFAATQPVNFKNKILGTKNWGDIFHQGLAARMLFTMDEAEGPVIENTEGYHSVEYIKGAVKSIALATTREQLKAIPKAIEYEKVFIEIFDAFYFEFKAERIKEDLASNHNSIMAPIIARRLENAIKIALIYSACEILEGKPLLLKIEHLIRAVDLCKYFERILDRIVYGDDENDGLERVFERIKNSGAKYLSQREIARKNEQKSQDVATYIAKLLSQKRIEAISYKPLRGPAKITYKIK